MRAADDRASVVAVPVKYVYSHGTSTSVGERRAERVVSVLSLVNGVDMDVDVGEVVLEVMEGREWLARGR